MAALGFDFRQSTADSYDDNRSRYIPSSVYSGPGPEVEALAPVQPFQPVQPMYTRGSLQHGGRNGFQTNNGLPSPFTPRPRNSDALNVSDPVAMHLLIETALGDSKNFEILSFEELEQLKRERVLLRNRLEATKRKLALESKLRDAAQSLNRLYSRSRTGGSTDKGHRRSPTGSKNSNSEASNRAEDELIASTKKIEELTQEQKRLELKLDDTQRRVLEHTAGILQLTHKGLKKNLRKHELPRSPESMASPGHRSVSGGPLLDEFDERSLYPVPDYVNDFMATSPMAPIFPNKTKVNNDLQTLTDIGTRMNELSSRLHNVVLQSNVFESVEEPPMSVSSGSSGRPDEHIQNQMAFLSRNLDALALAQQRTVEQSDHLNTRLQQMVEKTDSVSRSPLLIQDEPRGEDVASQLAYSARVLEQLHSRVETLVEQKDILTRQIQQQRELNTKSDAQRDAQIHDLTEELTETKRSHAMSEREAHQAQDQIAQLIEQVDRAKQDSYLMEQQRSMNDSNALQAEREARRDAEKRLMAEVEAKQFMNTQLQADMSKIQNEFELRSQQHIQQLNDLTKAKEQAEIEAQSYHSESEKLLEQIAGIQTELTMAKAELDGAYGSRAQRAADVSSNPAVQKQLDLLRSEKSQLQRELKDTIEDYEQMTKASIEFEKERDNLEASIDSLRDKCESLETQLNEEKLKQLGMRSTNTNDTTSTTVLKNEFKKMMRDTKADSFKALRAEQEERRRLQQEIRQMKKDLGIATPAKSVSGTPMLSAAPLPST